MHGLAYLQQTSKVPQGEEINVVYPVLLKKLDIFSRFYMTIAFMSIVVRFPMVSVQFYG